MTQTYFEQMRVPLLFLLASGFVVGSLDYRFGSSIAAKFLSGVVKLMTSDAKSTPDLPEQVQLQSEAGARRVARFILFLSWWMRAAILFVAGVAVIAVAHLYFPKFPGAGAKIPAFSQWKDFFPVGFMPLFFVWFFLEAAMNPAGKTVDDKTRLHVLAGIVDLLSEPFYDEATQEDRAVLKDFLAHLKYAQVIHLGRFGWYRVIPHGERTILDYPVANAMSPAMGQIRILKSSSALDTNSYDMVVPCSPMQGIVGYRYRDYLALIGVSLLVPAIWGFFVLGICWGTLAGWWVMKESPAAATYKEIFHFQTIEAQNRSKGSA